jgi:hypothetical protein
MNMFWNRKLSSEWGSAAVLHILRAVTIAAVVSSCSTSPPRSPAVLAEAEEPSPPPLVMLLDPASSLAEGIKDYAWNAYQNLSTEEKNPYQDLLNDKSQLQDVHVTITYVDTNRQERLLSLAPSLPDPNNTTWEIDRDSLRIPRPPGPDTYTNNFRPDVKIHDTQSPATTTYCWRSGGSRYCEF